jgi:hypothetical protein
MAKKSPLSDQLARELGYKDAAELKKVLSKEKRGSLKDRLESGQGFGEAISGSFAQKTTDIKESFSKKGVQKLGRRAYRSFFSGDDIFSAYMRGRINKREKEEDEEEPRKKDKSSDDSAFVRVIAKESMMLPGVARDMNVMRQNIQKLVKIWSAKSDVGSAKGKSYAQGADEFFMREDQREAELEASRVKGKNSDTSPTAEKDEKEGGLLDGIMSFFSKGFMSAIKAIFNPKTLMKVFSKVFLPIVIIGTLFSGIKDGFKKYQETGSFSEALISGLGGMLKFLTFGMFGEDTIKKLFESITNFFAPITETISGIFTGIKDFFVKMFGGQVKVEDKTPAKMDDVKPSMKESKPASELETKAQTPEAEKTTTTTPTRAPTTEAKTVEKISGEKIRLPAGVTYDPIGGGYSYKGRMFAAADQKEIEIIKKAIDDGKIVEYQTTDDNIGKVTKTYNGATGESSLAPPKQTTVTPSPVASSPSAAPVSSGATSGGGSVSAGGGSSSGGSVSAAGGSSSGGSVSAGGGSSGDSVGATPTTPSGTSMSEASSDVAEGQRMESAADQGSVVNAPTTNNNSTTQGQSKQKSSDVFDSDLASILATT